MHPVEGAFIVNLGDRDHVGDMYCMPQPYHLELTIFDMQFLSNSEGLFKNADH